MGGYRAGNPEIGERLLDTAARRLASEVEALLAGIEDAATRGRRPVPAPVVARDVWLRSPPGRSAVGERADHQLQGDGTSRSACARPRIVRMPLYTLASQISSGGVSSGKLPLNPAFSSYVSA